jgi:hypothetical protein
MADKYRGVTHNKTNNKYAAGVALGRSKIHLGYYNDAHSAALAYNVGSQIVLGPRPALLLNQVPPEHQPTAEQVQKIEELVRWYIEQARTKGRLPAEPV